MHAVEAGQRCSRRSVHGLQADQALLVARAIERRESIQRQLSQRDQRRVPSQVICLLL